MKILKSKTFHGNGGPYLTVHTLLDFKLLKRISICLHEFHRSDEDPDCHDHPFSYGSFILHGQYREHSHDESFTDRHQFSFAYRPATHRHRVELLTTGLWTLCIKIDAKRNWGFWRQNQFIPWRDYIKAKGLLPQD